MTQSSIPLVAAGTGDVEQGAQGAKGAEPQAKRGGITLEWRDVHCWVAEKIKQGRVAKFLGLEEREEREPTKHILKGASGFAKAGEILAVMGPSGSGKTTLLNVLADRATLGHHGKWTGNILLNGSEPWKDWERDMAYCMQKDIFYDELKVNENLKTTALLRLPSDWPKAAKLEYLDIIIRDIGLEKVKTTKIGTAVDRGLSGGEVKRTSIANESLALPRIFLLDEPLTGLDSSRAVDIMTGLHKMAHEQGTTIMLTIHQPSSAIYATFDRLLLMGPGGHTAFCGPVEEAVPYFSRLGHHIPENWAPSDHFIELLADETKRDEICDAWTRAPLREPVPDPAPRPPALTPMPTFTGQLKVLLPRSFKRIRRSYLKALNWKLHIGLSVTWGFIYWGVGNSPSTRITDFVGAIFFIVAHWSWTPLFQGLGNFPREKEMLTKERASKLYEIRSFFVSQVLAEAPVLLVFPLVFFAIIWPMAALPNQVLLPTFLMTALNIQVCSAMSMLVSAVCMDQDAAVTCAIIVMILQMCAGGYFADMRKLPAWVGWIRFFSVYYYSFGAILRLTVEVPYGEDLHHQAIEKYSFSDAGYFWEVTMELVMIAVMRFATYLQLRYTKKLKFT